MKIQLVGGARDGQEYHVPDNIHTIELPDTQPMPEPDETHPTTPLARTLEYHRSLARPDRFLLQRKNPK